MFYPVLSGGLMFFVGELVGFVIQGKRKKGTVVATNGLSVSIKFNPDHKKTLILHKDFVSKIEPKQPKLTKHAIQRINERFEDPAVFLENPLEVLKGAKEVFKQVQDEYGSRTFCNYKLGIVFVTNKSKTSIITSYSSASFEHKKKIIYRSESLEQSLLTEEATTSSIENLPEDLASQVGCHLRKVFKRERKIERKRLKHKNTNGKI